jgi:hypothetical protein
MNAKPFDLAAMQATCDAAGEAVRQEAIASGQTLPVWDDVRGVIEIDPETGWEVDPINGLVLPKQPPSDHSNYFDLARPLVSKERVLHTDARPADD